MVLPKRKENRHEWNSRIQQGGIPPYDPMEDKNCFMYQASVEAHKRPSSVPQPRPGLADIKKICGPTRRPLRPTSPRLKEVPPRRPISQSGRQRHLFEDLKAHIEEVWESFDIPECHRQLYAAKFLVPSTPPAELLKEAQHFAAMTAPVQRVMRLCDDRELLLKRLEVFAKVVKDRREQFSRESELKEISDLLNELREVSLQLVSTIVKWRMQVSPPLNKFDVHNAEHAVWLYNGGNYLLKMKNDTQWAANSALNQIVEFSDKFDPFFVFPSLKMAFPSDLKSKARLRNAMRPFVPLANWELQLDALACRTSATVSLTPPLQTAAQTPAQTPTDTPTHIAAQRKADITSMSLTEVVAGSPNATPTVAPLDVQKAAPNGHADVQAPAVPSRLVQRTETQIPKITPITLTADVLKAKLDKMGLSARLQESIEAPNFDSPNEWYWIGDIGAFAFKLKKGAPAACVVTYVTVALENLATALVAIKHYVFTNVVVGSIRITLWYIGDGDNYHLDREIEEVLTEHKFGWFTLTNTADRRRGQVYNCRRTKEDPPMPDSQACVRAQVYAIPSSAEGGSPNNPSGCGLLSSDVIRAFHLDGSNAQPSRVISMSSQLPARIPATRTKLLDATDAFDEFFEVFGPNAPIFPTRADPSARRLPARLPCGALAVELDWPLETLVEWDAETFTVKAHMVGLSSPSQCPVVYLATDDEDIFVVVIPLDDTAAAQCRRSNVYDFASQCLMDCDEKESGCGPQAVRMPVVSSKTLFQVGPLTLTQEDEAPGEGGRQECKFMLSEHAGITINAGRRVCTLPTALKAREAEVLDLSTRPYLLCLHHISCELPLHVVAA
eukprot:GEMP01019375.1.p1 GENE.GEMP01019375.1~~GEMP01019375.1.p1  ORF type:complete len:840 (+),score=163.52 GEMP01019375.1:29-2548(+)